MNYRQSQDGFTLIEVLIVITIIGILAAIAIPSYSSFIEKAHNSACLSEVKGYSDNIYYILNDQNDSSLPVAPYISDCQFITDATGWTSATQQKIVAVAKPPSNARIECDIPNGAPCRVLP